jgi:hypothetical protein
MAELVKEAEGGYVPAMVLLGEIALLGNREPLPGVHFPSVTVHLRLAELPPESLRRTCCRLLTDAAAAAAAGAWPAYDDEHTRVSGLSIRLSTHSDAMLLLSLGTCFGQADLEEVALTGQSRC